MANILFSVPHTGTRSLQAYLDHLNVVYRFFHTTKEDAEKLLYEKGSKLIIPMRDPLLCFLDHMRLSSDSEAIKTCDMVVKYWEILEKEEQGFDRIYLRLDNEPLIKQLADIADFIGAESESYDWKMKGLADDRYCDYDLWGRWKAYHGKEVSNYVEEQLAPHRKYYGY